MSSADCFNLDKSKILSSGNGLKPLSQESDNYTERKKFSRTLFISLQDLGRKYKYTNSYK